jgi:hypothetical protein
MVSVRVEEAGYFYEEDEDPGEVFAAFSIGQKGRTAPPRDRGASSGWSAGRRFGIAAVLRRLAKAIDPSHVRTP